MLFSTLCLYALSLSHSGSVPVVAPFLRFSSALKAAIAKVPDPDGTVCPLLPETVTAILNGSRSVMVVLAKDHAEVFHRRKEIPSRVLLAHHAPA